MIPVIFSQRRSNPLAIITGVNGQDGSYLAEFLLDKGYSVVGIIRRSSTDNKDRIKGIIDHPHFKLVEGDITDSSNVNSWITEFSPDEFYNLAAQSHVGTSFKQPQLTWRVNAEGVVNILEAIKTIKPNTRLYQASTSEMFGRNYSVAPPRDQFEKEKKFQNEDTPFAPQSPYGVSKVAAHQSVQLYRQFGIFGCCGILFNHESPRRGEQFVTRKITKWIGEYIRWRDNVLKRIDYQNSIKKYIKEEELSDRLMYNDDYILLLDQKFPKLRLGNLDAYRDWGHARDYVEAMWLMLQHDEPDDYVICTGESYRVKDFLISAFTYAGIIEYKEHYLIDPKFVRPAEVDYLRGDSSKARRKLGWMPKTPIQKLVQEMVDNDIENG
jgi:GDPmannose 4,6-dehydratase